MRNKMIELMQEANEHLNDICAVRESCEDCRYGEDPDCLFGAIADHLLANIRELDTENEAGLTIRNLQLESEVKQLRSKLAESAPQWIPVSEPPKEDGCHLVTDKTGDIFVGFYWGEQNIWVDEGWEIFPTYWNTMPLPEPPKGE